MFFDSSLAFLRFFCLVVRFWSLRFLFCVFCFRCRRFLLFAFLAVVVSFLLASLAVAVAVVSFLAAAGEWLPR